MCGPSSQEKAAQAQQAQTAALQQDYMKQYMAIFQQQFAKQDVVLKDINSQLQPILDKGINQQGFSKEEVSALNSQALNTTGANYANAARALGTAQAAGSTSTIESGVQQQQRAALASSAAAQTGSEELGITEANYAQGRQNYLTALSGEQSLAAAYNPQSYGGLNVSAGQSATAGNQAAFNEAHTINQESNQWEADIMGGVMAGVGMVSGGLGNLDKTGGSTGGEQAMNFLSGL